MRLAGLVWEGGEAMNATNLVKAVASFAFGFGAVWCIVILLRAAGKL
jgi:hypothetical protein